MSQDSLPKITPPASISGVTLRAVMVGDAEFLLQLYASTRQEELDATGWDLHQRAAFLQMQFQAQQAGYREMFPEARFQMILRNGERIGRRIVNRTPEEFRLVHLALLPAHRGGGIGTAIIGEILAEAASARHPVRLHVLKESRALRLYTRCGFRKTGESGCYDLMEWRG